MNVPPTEFVRVMPDDLRNLVANLFTKADVSNADATLIADLLVATDLRGVFSHGTRTTPGYVRQFLDGQLNPRPTVRVMHETLTTAVVDGDGGLGHMPSYRAACLAVQKARTHGLGAAVTRNHGHFGAAGKYSRIALEADCVGFAVSSHIPRLTVDQPVMGAGGGSPMSFAIPSGTEPPLVLDMGCSPDRWPGTPGFEELFGKMPAIFFKFLGLGAVCQGLGGIMAGIHALEKQSPRRYEGANQGAFICAIDISRFMPMDEFKREMDDYVRRVRTMQPFPGHERADLPGGLEWEREREWSRVGIPVGQEHRAALEGIAAELGLDVPWPRR